MSDIIADKKLAIEIATVFKGFFPGIWKHHLAGDTSYDEIVRCGKCDKILHDKRKPLMEWWRPEFDELCTVPDSIDVKDFNKAMEVFRRFASKYENKNDALDIALENITPRGYDPLGWVACFATPQQIWEICLMTVKEEKKKKRKKKPQFNPLDNFYP